MTIKIFAGIGALMCLFIFIGIAHDISEFDQTSGGYEAPYENVTGEPVDWDSLDITNEGFAKRGRIINVLVNGTSGMISFEIWGLRLDWRTFSERALVVHKPHEAFLKAGFHPEF